VQPLLNGDTLRVSLKTPSQPRQLLFLPGAAGRVSLWRPVADLLRHPAEKIHIGWPGFGPTPADPSVNGINDLVRIVTAKLNEPTGLIAQSMGGVIALLAALEKPSLVTHLVLTVTSGGIDLSGLGVQDWRPSFRASNPGLPRWFTDYRVDLEPKLSAIQAPALLLWGDADPISPIAVGERLASVLPKAELHVFSGGTHDLANELAAEVAPIIDAHLSKTA
jgi:pimeloyl-ACP methyl ester carboxylesterase